MKLLIITQKLDKNDPVLGFFHGWVEEFAKKCEKVMVIALGVGEYDLPENTKVLSLGKPAQGWSASGGEKLFLKLKYIFNFYKYIWRERKNYDTVFVHMNQEYVLLGWKTWWLMRKKIYLWRNHSKGGFLTRLAILFSHKVFYTSEFSFTARYKKAIKMPAGINIKRFKKYDLRFKDNDSSSMIHDSCFKILSLGRISPVKKIDVLVDALKILDKRGAIFAANVYGDAPDRDKGYYEKVLGEAKGLGEKGKIVFHKAVVNKDVPAVCGQNDLFVNLTSSGSLDKTILEAMACEIPVLVCNKSFAGILPEQFLFEENSVEDLADKLENIMKLSQEERGNYGKQFRKYVVENHSLEKLVDKIIKISE
jgi:glycosyltransferase involved in cell wall biosynthesis